MDPSAPFGFEQSCTAIVGAMAKALAERHGEPPEQRLWRFQAALHATLGFVPRDPPEMILASRCVMFHELTIDSVQDTLRTAGAAPLPRPRAGQWREVIALDRAFRANLGDLRHYQQREAQGQRDVPASGRGEVAEPDAAQTAAPAASGPAPADQPAAPTTVAAPHRATTPQAELVAAREPIVAKQAPAAATPAPVSAGRPQHSGAHGANATLQAEPGVAREAVMSRLAAAASAASPLPDAQPQLPRSAPAIPHAQTAGGSGPAVAARQAAASPDQPQ